jgi:hypothetical protein
MNVNGYTLHIDNGLSTLLRIWAAQGGYVIKDISMKSTYDLVIMPDDFPFSDGYNSFSFKVLNDGIGTITANSDVQRFATISDNNITIKGFPMTIDNKATGVARLRVLVGYVAKDVA